MGRCATPPHASTKYNPKGQSEMNTLIGMLTRLQPREPHFHVKIENPPYMPLTIEGIGTGPRNLPAVSVTHYGEQNGDLMRDPEMCFEMEIQSGQIVALMPYYYRNDYMGIEEQSVTEGQHGQGGEQTVLSHFKQIYQHGKFARAWDRNLKRQGFEAALQRMLDSAAG
jgi:hypothetical protein